MTNLMKDAPSTSRSLTVLPIEPSGANNSRIADSVSSGAQQFNESKVVVPHLEFGLDRGVRFAAIRSPSDRATDSFHRETYAKLIAYEERVSIQPAYPKRER